ncbi:MAG TPA: FAD-binding protein [Xanthobacteraceae bacterium]|jgi:glycolate oxidase FAD binding subunit
MTETLKARDAKDVENAVQWALGEGRALEIIGHGSKRAIGRPLQTDLSLDLSTLSGVTLYEPEELVLSAKAGTSLSEIEALAAAKGQRLAFEPMDCGQLFGSTTGRGSIAGTIAANLCGPRRITAGAARDHLLGFVAVSGRGETFRSGGRVVKNVTGYDLCKLMAGSFGTLAVLTEVTVKTLPKPETEATVVMSGLDDAAATRAMTAAMGSGCEVSGAAHLPAATAARFPMGDAVAAGRALTALRLEGVEPSVAHSKAALLAALRSLGEATLIDDTVSRRLWVAIRDVAAFGSSRSGPEQPLWRISTTPTLGHQLVARLTGEVAAEVLYDWAGGLLWVAIPDAADAAAGAVRAAVKALGGHATLVRAPAQLRAAIDVFEPQEPGLAALTKRVKESFDPNGVLNPGRMWAHV